MPFKKISFYLILIIIISIIGYFVFKSLSSKESKTFSLQGSCLSDQKVSNLTLLQIQKNLNTFIPVESQMPKEENGALSENIPKYISVRFQNAIYYLAVNAVQNQQIDTLDKFFKVADYSFSFQNDDGSFKFALPPNSSKTPTKGDLLSGAVFFLSAFAISLVLISQSNWYSGLSQNIAYKDKINGYKIQLSKALDNIIDNKQALKDYDKIYSNRLFLMPWLSLLVPKHFWRVMLNI